MNLIDIDAGLTKEEVFIRAKNFIEEKGFRISKIDQTRPWGGFFVLDEAQIREFSLMFFSDISLSEEQFEQKLSPKFLLVSPNSRLSWQYHYRRAELWKLINGESGIVRSDSNEEGELMHMESGKTISLKQGERHRLVGLDAWGIVAEIWMHVDPENPSDEEDIVRLQDDYSRK